MAVRLSARDVVDDAPVIPVIVVNEPAQAVHLARALVAGGIRMLEVTLRTPQALACIAAIAREVPDAVAGAGTVRSADDVIASVDAGARFLLSPGYVPALGTAARDAGVPLLPGVATATEVMAAASDGHRVQKFFPAVAAGGLGLLKAWAGPFPDVSFCPTGGIGAGNAPDFLALPNVACVGGSWIVPEEAVAAGQWERITQLAQEASGLARNRSGREIG